MAYRIMKSLINSKTKRNKEDLLTKCDVYYGAGRLTVDQYNELIEMINEKFAE